jgi:chromosome segregation ATPase
MTADVLTENRSVLRDIDTALEPMRRKQRDLQTFMASQLERLEMLAGQLDEREREQGELSEQLAQERNALDVEWNRLDSLIETAQANALEIRQEKQRLDSLSRDHLDGPQLRELKHLREEVEQLAHERRVVENELEAAQRKVGQLADTAVELSETRAELAATQAEIERMRREPSRIDAAGLAELQHRLAIAQEDRERLSGEVRRLKLREAELQKQRDEDNRRYTDERLDWLAELRSLRRSFELKPSTPGEQRTEREQRAERESRESSPEPAAPLPKAEEPNAFDQVLDQFEAVKRDAAKRRARKQ